MLTYLISPVYKKDFSMYLNVDSINFFFQFLLIYCVCLKLKLHTKNVLKTGVSLVFCKKNDCFVYNQAI